MYYLRNFQTLLLHLQTQHLNDQFIKKQIDRGDVNIAVRERMANCPGYPTECKVRDSKTNKWKFNYQKCILCQTQTKWYCMICRAYYCMDNNPTKSRKVRYYSVKEAKNNQERKYICGKSCFHEHHEEYHCNRFDSEHFSE